MYSILDLKANIRVPPQFLGKELREAVAAAIEKEFVGFWGEEGIFLSVIDIKEVGEGKIIHGDGAVYYATTFSVLAFRPVLHELIEGEASEITEFGVFVKIGPVDGLVHVSQVMDDYVNYSEAGMLTGKESKRTLKAKEKVRARIIAISLKSVKGSKIGLTMRQPGLGKLEWLESDKNKAVEEAVKKERGEKEGAEKKPEKKKKAPKK
jgi:DNA-directed RNA polymerase subunit E'